MEANPSMTVKQIRALKGRKVRFVFDCIEGDGRQPWAMASLAMLKRLLKGKPPNLLIAAEDERDWLTIYVDLGAQA